MSELSLGKYQTPYNEFAGDQELFELVAVPLADEPEIFNDSNFAFAPDAVEQLIAAGFDEAQAQGLAVVFCDKPADGTGELTAPGFQHGDDYLIKGDDELYRQFSLAVHVPKGLNPEDANRAIWHQLGHRLFRPNDEGKAREPQASEDALAKVLGILVDVELKNLELEENRAYREIFELQNWHARLIVDKNA